MSGELDPHQQQVFRRDLIKAAYAALEKAARDGIQEFARYRMRPGGIRSVLVVQHVDDMPAALSDRDMLARIYRRNGAARFAAWVREIQSDDDG